MSTVIKVENLSKRYRLGLKESRKDTLMGQIGQTLRAPLDNFKRLRSMTRFDQEDDSVFWALRDINFEVKQGEVLGIIGHNGAGKSTLLKILSRITEPTDGRILVNGRIAALLEVGTGFHQDLTGRENIYMNGTILGMTRKEIDRKLDEIVDFSGVEKHLDTPVKFYSSGMKVRLGFAVAAHLEPEILVVDEVLAVGDAEFQRKAIGKMQEVSREGGRTVLFVSHNMGSMRQLCNRGILIENGQTKISAGIDEVISSYLSNIDRKNRFAISDQLNLPIYVKEVRLLNTEKRTLTINDSIEIKLKYCVAKAENKHSIAVRLKKNNEVVFLIFVEKEGSHILDNDIGVFELTMKGFPDRLLKAGTYSFDILVGIKRTMPIQELNDCLVFDYELFDENHFESPYAKDRQGLIVPEVIWSK